MKSEIVVIAKLRRLCRTREKSITTKRLPWIFPSSDDWLSMRIQTTINLSHGIGMQAASRSSTSQKSCLLQGSKLAALSVNFWETNTWLRLRCFVREIKKDLNGSSKTNSTFRLQRSEIKRLWRSESSSLKKTSWRIERLRKQSVRLNLMKRWRSMMRRCKERRIFRRLRFANRCELSSSNWMNAQTN